jgi:hypothetical protein
VELAKPRLFRLAKSERTLDVLQRYPAATAPPLNPV